jgi:hypothetical protein
MANTLDHGRCLSHAMQDATGVSLPIGALAIGVAGHGLQQLLEAASGEPVALVVKDDVWWPLGRAGHAMHDNASFIGAVLAFHFGFRTGDVPDLPAGATPGPWWIENTDGYGEAAIVEPLVAIMAMSQLGKETLAYVRGRALAERIVDAANRSAPDDPCF